MRALLILRHVIPLALSWRRDWVRWIFFGKKTPRSRQFHERRARRITRMATDLGPAFVKLGQVFSARPDIVREPYLGILGTLTDQLPYVPFEQIEAQILKEYGKPWSEVLEHMEHTPLAAGSLGQVYKARYQGQDVVVKVLRPGVEELVATDVKVSKWIVDKVLHYWPNRHLRNFRVVLEEFEQKTTLEMDFRLEAENGRIIKAMFAGERHIVIPSVYHELTRKRVLVMEYAPGTRVDSPDLEAVVGDKTQVVYAVIEMYIRMMLVEGLFHADPHPGNLLVRSDGVIVLLDFGMVIPVGQETRKHLARTALAAVGRDAKGVTDGFYDLGIVEPGTNRQAIHDLVEVLFRIAFDGTRTRVAMGHLTEEVLETLYDWPVLLTGEMVYFGRAVSLIEGLAARMCPKVSAVKLATPVIIRHRAIILRAIGETGNSQDAFKLMAAEVTTSLGKAWGDIKRSVLRHGVDLVGPTEAAEIAMFVNLLKGGSQSGK